MSFVPVLFVSLAAISSPQGTAAAASAASPERLICREEKIPNSRFTKRRCVTASEEEAIRRDAQDAMKRVVDAPALAPPSDGK